MNNNPNILNYNFLQAHYKMLVKRFIKGSNISELKIKVEKYNQEFLKDKNMYLNYNDLDIKHIKNELYYIKLSNNEFIYNTNDNTLKELTLNYY